MFSKNLHDSSQIDSYFIKCEMHLYQIPYGHILLLTVHNVYNINNSWVSLTEFFILLIAVMMLYISQVLDFSMLFIIHKFSSIKMLKYIE